MLRDMSSVKREELVTTDVRPFRCKFQHIWKLMASGLSNGCMAVRPLDNGTMAREATIEVALLRLHCNILEDASIGTATTNERSDQVSIWAQDPRDQWWLPVIRDQPAGP
jgi:hypothetical protein